MRLRIRGCAGAGSREGADVNEQVKTDWVLLFLALIGILLGWMANARLDHLEEILKKGGLM